MARLYFGQMAYCRIQENARRLKEAPDSRIEYGLKHSWAEANRMPPPPEIEALYKERDAIYQNTRDNLRQELGEEYFDNLDAWVKHYCGYGEVILPTAVNKPNTGEQG
jgi:hypothetical protein